MANQYFKTTEQEWQKVKVGDLLISQHISWCDTWFAFVVARKKYEHSDRHYLRCLLHGEFRTDRTDARIAVVDFFVWDSRMLKVYKP